MSKRRSLESILKAMTAAGVPVARVEDYADGRTIVIAGKPGDATEFDSWEERIDAQNQKRAS